MAKQLWEQIRDENRRTANEEILAKAERLAIVKSISREAAVLEFLQTTEGKELYQKHIKEVRNKH